MFYFEMCMWKFLIFLGTLYILYCLFAKQTKKSASSTSILSTSKKDTAIGIIFGKQGKKIFYSPSDNEGHVFVTGGSGSGKTSSILIPTLNAFQGTFFCIDISGDICPNIQKNNKIVFDPEDSMASPYNIFDMIDTLSTLSEQNEALEQLAYLIMPENINMTDSALFFLTEGRKILTSAFLAFYHLGFDFIQICEIIYQNSWKDLFNLIDKTKNRDAIAYINSFLGTNEQNTAGCKQQADTAIKLFATNEKIKHALRRPHEKELYYSPQQLEKYNVFVNIQDAKLMLYAPLMHIITAQSLEYFSTRSKRNKHTILFALDEFPSLGKLDIIHALRTLRKKKIRIMILTQSLSDIDLLYGQNERICMMNNFDFKVILHAGDPDTQNYFSKLIGQKIIKRHSHTQSNGKNSNTTSEQKDWIIEPTDFSKLSDCLILIFPTGYIQLKKNYWFKK
ncbi:MAG: type IV secretory system conjugative DNA transfer family protein [Lachnospiraceae bacterium]|nr:type IV secretory system conjugative DNA transfer family protein [Lachnospiraceae bacterium]